MKQVQDQYESDTIYFVLYLKCEASTIKKNKISTKHLQNCFKFDFVLLQNQNQNQILKWFPSLYLWIMIKTWIAIITMKNVH